MEEKAAGRPDLSFSSLASVLQFVKAIQAEIQNYRSFTAFPSASALIFQLGLKSYINPLFCGLIKEYQYKTQNNGLKL